MIAPGVGVEYTVSSALVSHSTAAAQCIGGMHMQYLLQERKFPCGTNDCR